jgi:dTMP kinase
VRGRFITFEGLDGCGKSTQLSKLAEFLRKEGVDVVATREPGGTSLGESVRAIVLNSGTTALGPLAELALMFGARAQHIDEVIGPGLNAGKFVLCDRFTDSSEAYQGGGRQLGSEPVLTLHRVLCGNLQPDLTILMDSDPAASVERARRRNTTRHGLDHPSPPNTAAPGGPAQRGDENRFEQENRAFFERVQRTYREIARRETQRVVMLDARRPLEIVQREIAGIVRERLLGR